MQVFGKRWASWVVASVLVLAIACPPPDHCPFGVYPFPGQTAVPLDTVVEFRAFGDLPRDLPSLREAVWLRRSPNGGRVEVEIALDPEGGTIRLTPVDPLEPDTTYEAFGIEEANLGPHYLVDLSNDPIQARFSTASAPDVVWAGTLDEGLVVVVFSEPMNGATVDAGVSLVDDTGSSIGTYAGPREGYANQFVFLVDAEAGPVGFEISDTVRSDLGTPFVGSFAITLQNNQNRADLELFDSEPFCEEDW
jgi:hypothetical protein